MLPSCYREKPSVAVGLRAWPLPAWIRDCIRGKKVMEAIGSDLGQAPLRRISMLKSRARNGMTGAGRNSARWSDESMGGNDFGRLDCRQRPLGGETSRSACGGAYDGTLARTPDRLSEDSHESRHKLDRKDGLDGYFRLGAQPVTLPWPTSQAPQHCCTEKPAKARDCKHCRSPRLWSIADAARKLL